MKKLVYPACFYPYSNDEGSGYTVVVPDLLGCTTCGDSLAEAIEMGIDAASGWVLTEMEDGKPIPQASKPEDINSLMALSACLCWTWMLMPKNTAIKL